MIIYKLQQQKTNKVYVGYSVNDNPNNFGSGKYIKRAVKDFGTTSFNALRSSPLRNNSILW